MKVREGTGRRGAPPPVLDADEAGLRVVADGREAGGDAADRVEVDAVPAEVHQPRYVLRGVYILVYS